MTNYTEDYDRVATPNDDYIHDSPVTVKRVWDWLLHHWDLARIRHDRAIYSRTDRRPHLAQAVEVGYGSHTVRVRVFDGMQQIGLVDFDSRRRMTVQCDKFAELVALLLQAGHVRY